jgi:hypothetical protein
VEVSTRVDNEQIAVRLVFNDAGDVAQTIAERPRLQAGNATTTWIGEYFDYQQLGRVRLPTRGEVRWELPDGPFTYWRGTVTSADLEPYGSPAPATEPAAAALRKHVRWRSTRQ